jgi:hypothetical protein
MRRTRADAVGVLCLCYCLCFYTRDFEGMRVRSLAIDTRFNFIKIKGRAAYLQVNNFRADMSYGSCRSAIH